ncbi:MAG: RNA polymerase sigma factor [FCB group bacterium]|nr:RNA polymerase sigma factor [FCB group bacterium]
MTADQLLENLRSGSPDAFRQLVERYKHKVLNTCFRFVADKDDAEDIAQETFVEVHRSLPRFREESSLSTWIYQIAVSKSLDFMRKKNRKKRRGLFGGTIRLDDHPVDIPAPESENPEKQLQDKERNIILQQALDSLPKNQCAAFVLSKYDGMSYQEIANTLKTTVGAVESLIHRARKNLQKKLYNYYKKHV